jgi:RNA polymerase sigma factor (sigma-70 family)
MSRQSDHQAIAFSRPNLPGAQRPGKRQPRTTGEAERASPVALPAAADAAGWEAFVAAHGRLLARCVARAMTRVGWQPSAEEIQELVQEAYCRLLERRDVAAVVGRSEAQLWGYLSRVSHSVVVDHLRLRHARKRGGWPPPRCSEGDACSADDGSAPEPTPEERLLTRERARDVRRRVRLAFPGRLGERNLRVLELAAVEGLTAAEIAGRLGGEITASSVHTVLYRLRRLLTEPPAEDLVPATAG